MLQPLDPVELLNLVPNYELESFAQLLGYSLTTSNPREELAGKIQNYSRTKVVSALIAINGVWLTMMRDVVQFLEKCDVSMRTTGCVLILPINGEETKLYLSPQIADVVARFDASTLRPKTISDWDDALSTFRWLEPWLRQTAQDGEPTRHKRFNHRRIIQDIARNRPVTNLYEQEIRVDTKASEQMFCLWRMLDYLNAKLSPIADAPHLPAVAGELKDELSQWSLHFHQHINQMRYDHEIWYEITNSVERTDPWSESWTTEELFRNDCWRYDSNWDDWIRFTEDSFYR